LGSPRSEHRVSQDEDAAGVLPGHCRERRFDLGSGARSQNLQLHAEYLRRALCLSQQAAVALVVRVPENGHPGDLRRWSVPYDRRPPAPGDSDWLAISYSW
jgi:hypothetical protein